MPKRARLLYALQRVDLLWTRKGRRYKEVKAHLGESLALREARATLETATRDHAHWRAEARDRELEAQSTADKLAATQERLYSGRVTSPRELGDLQNETEYLKRRQAGLEDHQLEAMISLEEATTSLAVANEQFVVAEAAWKTENAELHQEYETLKAELTQLLSQRKQLIRAIDERDVSEYDSLRRLRKGIAVVATQQGKCSVCNVAIPKRDLERATQADEIMHCIGCDRILYVPQE